MPTNTPLQSQPPSRRRVLVADDEPAVRRLLQHNLQVRGFDPVMAVNGREAIAMADDDLACALVDLRMPEVDGMGVLDHLRTQHPAVPVIMISAAGSTLEAEAAIRRGAARFVAKPFIVDELVTLVATVARRGDGR